MDKSAKIGRTHGGAAVRLKGEVVAIDVVVKFEGRCVSVEKKMDVWTCFLFLFLLIYNFC